MPTVQFKGKNMIWNQHWSVPYHALEEVANLHFQPDKKRIVYAPACFLDEEHMERNQIEFVSIPYNLFQRKM